MERAALVDGDSRPEKNPASPLADPDLPLVFDAAYFLATRQNAKYVIAIGNMNAAGLRELGKTFQIVAVDDATSLAKLKDAWNEDTTHTRQPARLLGPLFDERPSATNDCQPLLIEQDLNAGLPQIPRSIASDAVVICTGVLNRLARPQTLLRDLASMALSCPFVMISEPHPAPSCHNAGHVLDDARAAASVATTAFASLLRSVGVKSELVGNTFAARGDRHKRTLLAIAGTQASPPVPARLARVLAVMHVFNERDILSASIQHLLLQGIDVRVVDNWSSDGSYEMARNLAAADPRVSVERFPAAGPSRYFDLKEIMSNVERIASEPTHDWIIHHDTDEFRASPWPGITLQQGISAADALGYNAIDFTVVEFKMTQDGFTDGADPERFFTYFDFGRFRGHFLQIKVWKTAHAANLIDSAGHHAAFPDQRIFPLKFLLKHYPLRSLHQAREKLFKNRAPRIPSEERGKRFIQYDLSDGARYLRDPADLRAFDPRTFASEYLLERISGAGILHDCGYATGFAS